MNIRDLLTKENVEIGAELFSKDEALEHLIHLQEEQGHITNRSVFKNELLQREEACNSAVAARIAIPSLCYSEADTTTLCAMTLKDGVDYDAPDKRKVKLIFMISGKRDSNEYLELKTRLMRLLMDSQFTAKLCAAKDEETFLDLLSKREQLRFSPPAPRAEYDCSKFLIKNHKRKFRDLFRHKSS